MNMGAKRLKDLKQEGRQLSLRPNTGLSDNK